MAGLPGKGSTSCNKSWTLSLTDHIVYRIQIVPEPAPHVTEQVGGERTLKVNMVSVHLMEPSPDVGVELSVERLHLPVDTQHLRLKVIHFISNKSGKQQQQHVRDTCHATRPRSPHNP